VGAGATLPPLLVELKGGPVLKLSKFIITEDRDDCVIVKQLSTGSLITLAPEDLNRLKRGEFDSLSSEDVAELLKCGFLVEGNENAMFLSDFRDWWTESDFMTLFVIPTNNCQCRCGYCYEDGIDRSQYMGDDVQARLLNWAGEYMDKHDGVKELNVVFHGGEPLLNPSAIHNLLPQLAQVAESRQKGFSVSIVTNGVRLDEKVLRALSQYDFRRLQLTLDGPRDVNDKRRILANGRGTFDTIWSKMHMALAKGFVDQIHLRVNIDTENLDLVEPLIWQLSEDPELHGRVHLSLGIVTSTTGCGDKVSAAQLYVERTQLTGADLVQKYLGLVKVAKELGFEIENEFMIGPWCAARHPNVWMVGPQGELYKCACDLGRVERSSGNIFGDYNDSTILDLTWQRLNDCLASDCELVPVCGGGCLFDFRVEAEVACRKEFLLAVNKGLMGFQVS
jgi:uncharacterized protein